MPPAAFAFNIFQNFGSCEAPINHWMPWAPLTALMTTNAFAMTNGAFGRSRRGEGGRRRRPCPTDPADRLRFLGGPSTAFYGAYAGLLRTACGPGTGFLRMLCEQVAVEGPLAVRGRFVEGP